jgi:hypothetical protein
MILETFANLTGFLISGRRRGHTSPNQNQGSRYVLAQRSSELTTSLSRLLKSDQQYLFGSPELGLVDRAYLPSPANWAPNDHLQFVAGSKISDSSKECITRSNLSSIMTARNFIAFLVSRSKSDPNFDFNQIVQPISADHLLTLLHFNLVRGLTANIVSMGVDPKLMHTDILSPFTSTERPDPGLHLPPMLRPTSLQRSIPHHPEIDVLPFPQMRDNLLRAIWDYSDFELCMDILGLDANAPSMTEVDRTDMTTGLIVWGEPWDPASWEVSERFARKWQWLLHGCAEALESTNYWRRRRGEPALVLEL